MGRDGEAWARDRFFHGGHTSDAAVAGWLPMEFDGTDDDPVYAEGRFFSAECKPDGGYRVPLSPGRYRLTLHFAENYFSGPGRRVFDVLAEGETVIESHDTFHEVGFASAHARTVELEVLDGLLELGFRWRSNNPRIVGLEIAPLD